MNSFCDACGRRNAADMNFCVSCGGSLKIPHSATHGFPESGQEQQSRKDPLLGAAPACELNPRTSSDAIERGKRLVLDMRATVGATHPHKVKAVAVIGATLLVWVMLELVHKANAPPSAWNYLAWTAFLLTLVPMSVGALMILILGSNTPHWFEKCAEWLEQREAHSRVSDGRFNRFIARPALWSYSALDHQATRLDDEMLRNGAKVATAAFCVILFCLLLFWLAAFAIAVVMLVVCIAVAAFFIDASDGTSSSSTRRLSGVLRKGLPPAGGNVYSGTNVFNEQLSGRIDENGEVFRGSNFFNEQKVGRVDPDGNHYEGTNFFNEKKTGRVDEDGNVYEGTNVFNEQKTGRVDEEGNVYEGTNAFNERKVGRVQKD